MSNTDNEIELPEIETTPDEHELAVAEALAAVENPSGADQLTLDEIKLIESGEAPPELIARLEAEMLAEANGDDADTDVGGEDALAVADDLPAGSEDDSSAVNQDADTMQSVISEQSLPPEPPAARDFATELAGIQASHAELAGQLKELIKAVEDGDKLESDILDERLAIEAKLHALATDRRLVEREQDGYNRQLEQFEQKRADYIKGWQQTCTDFVTVKNKDFYLNQDGTPNRERLAELDAMLKSTAAINKGMADADVLKIAHGKVLKLNGVEPAAAKKPAPVATAKKPAQLPPTLGSMPKAEMASAGSRFAALNNARGDQLVNAVAKMDEAQLDAWLREG